jgi:hypothetical protein
MAFDHERGQVVLFGGLLDGGPAGDTWIRENRRWRQLGVPGPPARNVHAMAYDDARRRVVLYGGIGPEGKLGDTWEWDGARWTEMP